MQWCQSMSSEHANNSTSPFRFVRERRKLPKLLQVHLHTIPRNREIYIYRPVMCSFMLRTTSRLCGSITGHSHVRSVVEGEMRTLSISNANQIGHCDVGASSTVLTWDLFTTSVGMRMPDGIGCADFVRRGATDSPDAMTCAYLRFYKVRIR